MITQVAIRGFDKNFSYFIDDEKGRDVAIVDPGDTDHLIATINLHEWLPKMILITHSHFDHVEGVGRLLEDYEIPVYMHENARGRVEVPESLAKYVRDGDVIEVGSLKVEVMYTPGHVDDAVCYYISAEEVVDSVPKLLTGDTLFVEGCGRADLDGASVEDLWGSLQKIVALPEETEIYAGHDYGSRPVSTLAWEKKRNKYLLCGDFEEFKALRLP